MLAGLEPRVTNAAAATALWPLFAVERGGKWQVTHYGLGQGYARHTDCSSRVPGTPANRRDRAATVQELEGTTILLCCCCVGHFQLQPDI